MTKHEEQRRLWNEEHAHPRILLPMDYLTPSGGVTWFRQWLKEHLYPHELGVEMGCGKGRNSLWLAKQGTSVEAFDFSSTAIEEARKRSHDEDRVHFQIHDATLHWPYRDDSFDFAIDCFASSDIEHAGGRAFARDEFFRTLKPGGHLFVQAISNESPFHAEMIVDRPATEPGAFNHPNGKFEKTYDETELRDFYSRFEIIEYERVEKDTPVTFYGKDYTCINHRLICRKT